MSDVADFWPTWRVVVTQKSPRHTQFISITAVKFKSTQTYGYPYIFVFELKNNRGIADMQRHVGCRHCVVLEGFAVPVLIERAPNTPGLWLPSTVR